MIDGKTCITMLYCRYTSSGIVGRVVKMRVMKVMMSLLRRRRTVVWRAGAGTPGRGWGRSWPPLSTRSLSCGRSSAAWSYRWSPGTGLLRLVLPTYHHIDIPVVQTRIDRLVKLQISWLSLERWRPCHDSLCIFRIQLHAQCFTLFKSYQFKAKFSAFFYNKIHLG